MARKPTKLETTVSKVKAAQTEHLTIYEFRGENVVVDDDVARLFGVETKRLNEQATRNAEKFGDDFAFRLTQQEFADFEVAKSDLK